MTTYTVQSKDGAFLLNVADYRLKADYPSLSGGHTRCALGIEYAGKVVLQDQARLGTTKGRTAILNRLGATHNQTITEDVLLALEKAIRENLVAQPRNHPNGKVVQFPVTPTTPIVPKTLSEVHATFQEWLYLPDTSALDLALATIVANHGSGDPVWLLIVDAPGGGKTEVINAISALPYMHGMSDFTEAGLLSGTAEKERAENATGGLLRTIGEFGILTIRDFGSILAMQQDIRGKILQDLREMYDGYWSREIGTDGGQKIEWKGKVGLIGAATPAIDQHHGVLASLGERFVFYRPLTSDAIKEQMARKALEDIGRETEMRFCLQQAVLGLFAGLDLKQPIPSLKPDQTDYLIHLSMLTVHCRSSVERDRLRREVDEVPEGEYPTRLVKVLALLYHGLTKIGIESYRAWDLTKQVALSSMPRSRRRVFEYLITTDQPDTTADIATTLDYPTTSIKRALEDLTCHTVAKRGKLGSGNVDTWVLSDFARNLWSMLEVKPAIQVGGTRKNNEGEGEGGDINNLFTPLSGSRVSSTSVKLPVISGNYCLLANADGTLATAGEVLVLEVVEKDGQEFIRFEQVGKDTYWPRGQCEVLSPQPDNPCSVCLNADWYWQDGWKCRVCALDEEVTAQ